MWGKRKLFTASGSANVCSLCGSQCEDSEKIQLEIAAPHDPTIPLLGIYPKNSISYSRDFCSSILIAILFRTASWE